MKKLAGFLLVLTFAILLGAVECDKQFTMEGTGNNEKEAVGDMLLKAEQACPKNCKGLKLVSQIHVFRETPVRASANFVCEKTTQRVPDKGKKPKKD